MRAGTCSIISTMKVQSMTRLSTKRGHDHGWPPEAEGKKATSVGVSTAVTWEVDGGRWEWEVAVGMVAGERWQGGREALWRVGVARGAPAERLRRRRPTLNRSATLGGGGTCVVIKRGGNVRVTALHACTRRMPACGSSTRTKASP